MLTALLAAAPILAEGPSFDLDDAESAKPADRTCTVSSADELAALGITGHGAREVANAVQQTLKGTPTGTKVRVAIGVATEGSTRWTYFYPRSVVPVDDQGRPDGVEFLAVDIVSTIGQIVRHRLIPWKNGVRQGTEKEYAGTALLAEIPWENGKMHGLRKTLFPNGNLQGETTYVDGVANGPTRLWDKDGQLLSEGNLKGGQRDGRFVEYWPGTKQPSRTLHYKDGVTHGLVSEYYKSGKLKRERAFRNEAPHGEDRLYNEDGTIAETRYWFDGDPVTKEEFKKRSKAKGKD
jgi:antitoxin component YwqK of YwqJK toxin-antitoxin module